MRSGFLKFILLSASTLLAMSWSAGFVRAQEQGVYSCGMPVQGDVSTQSAYGYCDVYTRQLAFGESQKSFHKQLAERQKDFIAPSLEARQHYEEQLDALYGWDKPKDDGKEAKPAEKQEAEKTEPAQPSP